MVLVQKIMMDITFISEFIYDYVNEYNLYFVYRRANNIIAMRLDDKWGVIDKDGNTAVPFCFEDVLVIDEETVFAKYEGKYGILDVKAAIE